MHWRCDWNLCLDGDYRLERGNNTPQKNHMSKWKITILPDAVGKGVWSPQRLRSRWGLSYLGQGLNRPSPQESISGRGADQCKGPWQRELGESGSWKVGRGAGEWRKRRSLWAELEQGGGSTLQMCSGVWSRFEEQWGLFPEGLFKGACRQDPGRETSGSLGMQWQFEWGAGGGDRCEPPVGRKACGWRWRLSKGSQGGWVGQEVQARVGRCRWASSSPAIRWANTA